MQILFWAIVIFTKQNLGFSCDQKTWFYFLSAGGLVTAVAPVVVNADGIWVGWPGIHLENPDEKIPESDPNDRTPTAGLKSEKVCNLLKKTI